MFQNLNFQSSIRLLNISSYSKDDLIKLLDTLLYKKEKEIEEISNDFSILNTKLNNFSKEYSRIEKENKELNTKLISIKLRLDQELDDKLILINDNQRLENEISHLKKKEVNFDNGDDIKGKGKDDLKLSNLSNAIGLNRIVNKDDVGNRFGFGSKNENSFDSKNNGKIKSFTHMDMMKTSNDKQDGGSLASEKYEYNFMYN